MPNKKIIYEIVRVELDLKNLCEDDRVSFRNRYNKILSDRSPLRPPNCTLTDEKTHSTATAYSIFINTSII